MVSVTVSRSFNITCVSLSSDQELRFESVTILFVEDDVGKRYVIARQLRQHGFDIDEAETGQQGLIVGNGHSPTWKR